MSVIARVRGRARGIYYGWWILASFNALTFYANGTLYYGFTAFFNPIAHEMGWSRAAVAAGASLFRMEAGEAFAPLIGYLFNRVGARRLMLAGALIVGIGFVALSQVRGLLQYYLAFTILALGFSLNFSTVMVPVLANWFHRMRGLAFGIQAGGNAVGGILVPLWPLLIEQHGWRTTLLFIGVASWAYCLPLSLVVRQRPEDMGLRPDGATAEQASARQSEPRGPRRVLREKSFTVSQVLRDRSFWVASAALTIWSAVINAVSVHLIPSLTDRGFSATTAALAVTGLTVVSILSRVGFGRLADTFDSKYLIAICFVFMAAGLAVLTFVSGPLLIPLFILAFFPAYGGVIPVRSQLLVDYYGPKAFPLLQGVMLMVTSVGGTLGPVLAGWVFDVTGSYTIAFVGFMVMAVVGIPLMLAAQPPREAPPGGPDTGLASAR